MRHCLCDLAGPLCRYEDGTPGLPGDQLDTATSEHAHKGADAPSLGVVDKGSGPGGADGRAYPRARGAGGVVTSLPGAADRSNGTGTGTGSSGRNGGTSNEVSLRAEVAKDGAVSGPTVLW